MKLFNRAISLFTALSIMSVMFTCLGIVPAVAAIPDGYEVKEQITLTFNNSGKGWSGTNSIANGTGNELVQVDDPDNSSNKYMSFSTPSSSGYNMELADADTSTTAYKMTASTSYTITIKFKVVSAGTNGTLALHFSTQAAYDSNLAKPTIKTWSASDYNNGDWNTVSYDFTTTDTMQANTYDTTTAKTNVCDRMYLVAKDSACEFYIDEVTITKYGPASTNTGDRKTTLTFNNSGTGWSGTNGTSSQLSQINDPNNSANKYMSLSTPSGSNTIAFSDDNSKLYFKVTPTGTMYTYEYSVAGTDSRFVND